MSEPLLERVGRLEHRRLLEDDQLGLEVQALTLLYPVVCRPLGASSVARSRLVDHRPAAPPHAPVLGGLDLVELVMVVGPLRRAVQ